MRILVEEDSGYRNWIWTPVAEDEHQLVMWWKSTMTSTYVDEFVFYDITEMEGDWEELESSFDLRIDEDFDGYASINNSHNTTLKIGTNNYSVESND